MQKIQIDEMSPEFYELWKAAVAHLDSLVQGERNAWRRCHPNPPFLEHLSFRLGNQNFFLRIRDADGRVDDGPGSLDGLLRVAEANGAYPCLLLMRKDESTGAWKPAYPCHFAPVVLASAEQAFERDDEPAVPLWRGHGMLVRFAGLER